MWDWQSPRYPASNHIGEAAKRPYHNSINIEIAIQPLQPVAVSKKHQPGQRDVSRSQRAFYIGQLRFGDPKIDRFMMQVLEYNARSGGEKRLCRDHFSTWLQL